jgi:hypothetical protein
MALYAQTDGKQHSTNFGKLAAILGLSITIPEGVGANAIIDSPATLTAILD